MDKKQLSERDICTKFITPALRRAGWDELTQRTGSKVIEREYREEVELPIAIDAKRRIDTSYEIYLGLYQAITGPEDRQKLYRELSPDFFDLIVVDELMALCDELEAAQKKCDGARTKLTNTAWGRVESVESTSTLNGRRLAARNVETLTRTRGQVDRIRPTILKLAATGRLVSHDPKDRPATQVLTRGKVGSNKAPSAEASRKTRRRGEYAIPPSWFWASFDEVAIIKSNLCIDRVTCRNGRRILADAARRRRIPTRSTFPRKRCDVFPATRRS